MGPPLLSSFKDLAGCYGQTSLGLALFAALLMAGEARSAPAADALIAETQAALDIRRCSQAANLADAGLNEQAMSRWSSAVGCCFIAAWRKNFWDFHDPAMRDFTAALNTNALAGRAKERKRCCSGAFYVTGWGSWKRRPRITRRHRAERRRPRHRAQQSRQYLSPPEQVRGGAARLPGSAFGWRRQAAIFLVWTWTDRGG